MNLKKTYWIGTTLTEEFQFHLSTPLGIKPGSLMTGSKWVDHWISGTVYECSEIAGSPHYFQNCAVHSHKSSLNWAVMPAV